MDLWRLMVWFGLNKWPFPGGTIPVNSLNINSPPFSSFRVNLFMSKTDQLGIYNSRQWIVDTYMYIHGQPSKGTCCLSHPVLFDIEFWFPELYMFWHLSYKPIDVRLSSNRKLYYTTKRRARTINDFGVTFFSPSIRY